jgi:hypothetical protein
MTVKHSVSKDYLKLGAKTDSWGEIKRTRKVTRRLTLRQEFLHSIQQNQFSVFFGRYET